MRSLIVLMLCVFLTACQSESPRLEVSKVEEDKKEDKPLIGIYSQVFESWVREFTEQYPEIKIKWYSLSGDIQDEVEKYGTVDLVLCDEWMAENLEEYWKNDGIVDLTELWVEDETISDEKYYSGVWEAGRVDDRLLALPIGIYVPYMTVRESVWNESEFVGLPEAYTAVELLEAMNRELAKGQEEDFEVFPGFFTWNMTDLLRMMGGIQESEEGIEVDYEIFSLLYSIFCQCQQRIEYVSFPGTYPLDNEGRFVGVCWSGWLYYLPPQLGVAYANSAIQAEYEEDVEVLYFPIAGKDQNFCAEVNVLGYVHGSSTQPERAYEVLRLMMDMPITSWDGPDTVRMGGNTLHCPVNREVAEGLLDNIDEMATKDDAFYSVYNPDQGRKEVAKYKMQSLSEAKQENIMSHLNQITQIYRRSKIDTDAEINSEVWVYIRNVGLAGVDDAYDAMVKAYQKDNQS